jgi:hypothetical protein
MKIINLRTEKHNARVRSCATVLWEDSGRPDQDIYFETDETFAEAITCNPHAFIVACTMPAMHFGEKRIYVDAEICPELQDGLITAMSLISNWFDWYKLDSSIVRIEAKQQKKILFPSKTPRAGFLFSGGIDSLATLRGNRVHYPPEHPGFIKDGLLIYGLEVRDPKEFDHVLKSVFILARDAGVTLIPVYTNIKDLGPENGKVFWEDFWIHEFMGATFSATAHAFSKRLSSLSINSCHDIPNLMPYASHPLLNPNFSSSDLKIRHEGIHLSRYEKTKLISDWDLALQHLRVCNRTEFYTDNTLNCGLCEKCVRTMLALEGSGALERTTAFPVNHLTQELVDEAVQLKENTLPLYGELLGPLAKVGRHDLVRAIKSKIADFYYRQKKERWRNNIIQPVVDFDEKYLGRNLKKMKRTILSLEAIRRFYQ